jgi:hypothetical protein
MPSPQVAAAAVLATLGFGVLAGGVGGPAGAAAAGAGAPLIVVRPSQPQVVASAPAPAPPRADAAERDSAADVAASGSGAPELVAPAPAPDRPAAAPAPAAAPPPPAGAPAEHGDGNDPPATPAPPPAAPIKHVWVVMLTGHGASAFGEGSPATYLRSLAAKGAVLQNYTAIAHGSLANGLALLTGRAPSARTLAGCPADPADPAGAGCVVPEATPTLLSQLTDGGLTWRAYVERPAAAPPTCVQPEAGDGRDPFAYLAAVTSAPDCAASVVGADQLERDVADRDRTPAVSFVVPGPCHDGRETACAEDAAAGLPAADAWLRTVLEPILASKAYADGGLVVVTFDSAPADGPEADSSGAPWLPAHWPGAPDGPQPGGGRVGALVLSPFTPPGTVFEDPYDHFALLRTIEDAFGLRPLGYARAKGVMPFGPGVLRPPTA